MTTRPEIVRIDGDYHFLYVEDMWPWYRRLWYEVQRAWYGPGWDE